MIPLQADVSTSSKECGRPQSTKERRYTALGDEAGQATQSKQQAVREGEAEVVHVRSTIDVRYTLFGNRPSLQPHRSETSCNCTLSGVVL